jgi:uncharacterized protein (TIGR02996 family)
MHPADDAFLAAIRDRPDDDLPRLVYADYLDERGDLRGEFIRVQIERATLLGDDPRRFDLVAREQELLRAHEEEWLGPLAEIVSNHEFRRGFISGVLVMTEAFVAHAETLFAWSPIHEVKLRGAAGWVKELAALPELQWLTAIDLCFDHLEPADAGLLVHSRYLTRLTDLNLNGNLIGDEGGLALAAAPALSRLTSLHLDSCNLTARSARALAESRQLAGLRELQVSDNSLGDAGVRALATAPFLKRFTALELTSVGMGDAGATALADCASLANVTWLRLGYNFIGDAGAAALASSRHLRRLYELDLNGNAIRDAGAGAILAAPHFRELKRLGLSINPLSADARRRLDDQFGERWA